MHIKQKWSSKFEVKPGSWVFVPTTETVVFGNVVKSIIESRWSPPHYYYHLRDGGHVKALLSHYDHEFFLHLDISNFFGCINKSRVTRCLKSYCSYEQAREIAAASTVHDPNSKTTVKFILPFGFVQSPIIASLCLYKSKVGRYLSDINRKDNVSVSVYMDDIVISANNKEYLDAVLEEIRPIFEASKFPLNRDKEEGPSEKITAFNIELSRGVLKITKKRFQEFITAYKEAENFDVLCGIEGYVSTVNIDQANELIKHI